MTTRLTSPLADAHPAAAERFQPGDLGSLIAWPQIKVQPVLDDLALGNLQEEQVRDDAILGAPLGRLEDHLVVRLKRAALRAPTATTTRSSPDRQCQCTGTGCVYPTMRRWPAPGASSNGLGICRPTRIDILCCRDALMPSAVDRMARRPGVVC